MPLWLHCTDRSPERGQIHARESAGGGKGGDHLPCGPDHPQPPARDPHHRGGPDGAGGHAWHPQTPPFAGGTPGEECAQRHRRSGPGGVTA